MSPQGRDFSGQSQGIFRIDVIPKRQAPVIVRDLVYLADPVIDHSFGAVMPSVVEVIQQQHFRELFRRSG